MTEKTKKQESEMNEACCCGNGADAHHKAVPRSDLQIKQLKDRLNRMTGQLNGISRMLDDNRYCGDILTQVAAVESALQGFGYVVLQNHMKTCVADEIRNGNDAIIDETVELIRKLK